MENESKTKRRKKKEREKDEKFKIEDVKMPDRETGRPPLKIISN